MIPPVFVCWSIARARRPGERLAGVADVTMEVYPGEVACLVGPHGAGKSMVLALGAGGLRPDRGSIRVAGVAPDVPAGRKVVGYAPAAPSLPASLTVREFLTYLATLHGGGAKTRSTVDEALAAADLRDIAGRRMCRLGSVERGLVNFAQATLGGRRMLLLDEPFAGLDAVERSRLSYAVQRQAGTGAAVLLAATAPAALERLVDRVFVLDQGRLVRAAPAEAMLGQRVLEVRLASPPGIPPDGFRLTPTGVEVDLGGSTPEAALAVCRHHRLAVRGSRVRLKSLEEVTREALTPSAR